jgi:DNA polymerase III subunit alpha
LKRRRGRADAATTLLTRTATSVFSHLHLHTEFSLLDGLSRIDGALDRVKALGQNAAAITDHGNLYGLIDFYKAAHKRGIKPLLGIEGYTAHGSRHQKDGGEKSPFHLGLIARNLEGYNNLLRLATMAQLEGYYYKPRMDRELLQKYSGGLLALSGCPSSEVHRALQNGRRDDAIATLRWYREIFDGHYYIEIQEHHDEQFSRLNPELIALGRELEIPVVVTNDSHYTAPEDAEGHDILLCIGTNSTVNDPKRMRMEGGSYYIKSEEEMRALFPDNPEVAENTARVADSVEEFKLEFGRLQLPDPELPDGATPMQHLAALSWEGLRRLYPDASDDVRARLEYELDVVEETGFPAYILLVREFAQYARAKDIPFGVRGSAAASIILYCVGITDIDPIKYRLVFERFLNRERREMPDIDMDIADDRRGELIQYVANRFGHDRVAQIITYGTLGPKAAIRDVARALGLPANEGDRISRLVPALPLHMTIERALQDSVELKTLYDNDAMVKDVVEKARQIEGIARHASVHAAGVVIAKDPLVEVAPLQRATRGDDQTLPVVCWDMNTVAEIGLLKMDFLGLSNLTILGKAVELVRARQDPAFDLKTIPDGDAKSYEMLKRAETFGVFQLESAGMRRHIQELKPESIAELSAMVALYRPGPMAHIPAFCRSKHGQEPVRYPHPDLAEILDETYGIIVYQDQVLLIAQKFGGYTLGQADIMRKAMGKKIAEKMRAEREHFRDGAIAKGYTAEDADKVFDLIEPFAGYAFNKAHATCYGTIAYQTAYLKANYPAEYMTALLMLAENHPAGFADRVAAAAAECAKLGLRVLPPDVNSSGLSFGIDTTPDGADAIRFGLSTIKNVGEGAVEGLIAERERNGPFASLEDFCRRAAAKTLNKRVLESLTQAGALDCFAAGAGMERAQYRSTLLVNVERIVSLVQREQRLRDSGQATMFDMFGAEMPVQLPDLELQPATALPQREILRREKELLGVYVSEHPFQAAAQALAGQIDMLIAEVTPETAAGREVRLAGTVTGIRTLLTRDGKGFCAATVEDLSGQIEVTVWPDLYETTRELWADGKIIRFTARLSQRDERVNITVKNVAEYDPHLSGETATAERQIAREAEGHAPPPKVEPAWKTRQNAKAAAAPPRPLRFLLRIEIAERPEAEEDDRRRLATLVAQLRDAPGEDRVRLVLRTPARRYEMDLPSCRLSSELEATLDRLLKADNWGSWEAQGIPESVALAAEVA